MDRIVEALEANMWDGMRRKDIRAGGAHHLDSGHIDDDDGEELVDDGDDVFGDFEGMSMNTGCGHVRETTSCTW